MRKALKHDGSLSNTSLISTSRLYLVFAGGWLKGTREGNDYYHENGKSQCRRISCDGVRGLDELSLQVVCDLSRRLTGRSYYGGKGSPCRRDRVILVCSSITFLALVLSATLGTEVCSH